MTVPAEFERTVLPHLNAAHNLARWLVREPALAEDVVQDAMVRALSYFGTYRGGDARAWLLRIVRNTAYTTMTIRRRTAMTSLDAAASETEASAPFQVPDPADDPEAALAHRQRAGTLEQALAALPLELRECLVLRELEELSYKQIATITDVAIGTVMSRLWRARRALMQGRDRAEEGMA